MKRAVNIVLMVLLLTLLVASAGLYAYRVELVWVVVRNDMVQKAPDGYPQAQIYSAFDEARRRVQTGALRKEELLERLFELSQRLEKTQYLTPDEVDSMLQILTGQSRLDSDLHGQRFSEHGQYS